MSSQQTSPSSHDVAKVMEILLRTYPGHPMHEAFQHDPFQMLVAVILSQRATDAMTIPVAKALFSRASNPQSLANLPQTELETIIRPIGFYRQKARALKKLSAVLHKQFNDQVPSTETELLSLPQVGRKTANIMLTMFFHTPQIAVDVHVQRISNRLGWIQTKTPEETELKLTNLIPEKFIPVTNYVFVRHGQTTCVPISPWCSRCPVRLYCKRVGVTRSR